MTEPHPEWEMYAAMYRSPALRPRDVPTPDFPASYVYNATVVNVVDGDSINVTLSFGFHRYDTPVPIRLLGCNAAEKATPGGAAAKVNLTALLPPGTPLVLQTAAPDKYAPRVDAAVTFLLNGSPTDLVATLVAEQWAAPWNGAGKAPVPPWPRTVAATRTPAEYVARARRQMLDAGENPDQPVFACEAGRPTHGGGGE